MKYISASTKCSLYIHAHKRQVNICQHAYAVAGPQKNFKVPERTTKHQTMAARPAVTPSAQWNYSSSAQSAMSQTSICTLQGLWCWGTVGVGGLMNQIKANFLLFSLWWRRVAMFKATLQNDLVPQTGIWRQLWKFWTSSARTPVWSIASAML